VGTEFILVVGLTVLIAGFVQGTLGFGFGMVAMSVIPVYVDVTVAVPIVAFFGVCMNAMLIYGLRRHFDLKKLGPMLLGGAIGAPVGVMLLRNTDSRYMKLALGVLIVFYVIYAFTAGKRRGAGVVKKDIPTFWGVVFGGMGGILQGGLNTGGPPVIIYATLKPWGKDAIKVTLLSFFWVIAIAQTAYFIGSGMFAGKTLTTSLILLPAMFLGAWIGVRVYDRINQEKFRIIVLIFLGAMGLNFIVRNIS